MSPPDSKLQRREILSDQYDAKIQQHRESIRQLREERNADCSSTADLPCEIMCQIFYELGLEAYKIPRSKRVEQLSWIVVMQVCRSWRRTALSHPRLWSSLVGVPTKWLDNTFGRSKSTPLHVRYGSDGCGKNEYLASLLLSPERFSRLEFNRCSAEFLKTHFNKPAPQLTSVTAMGYYEYFQLPWNLFAGEAPRLRELTLHYASVPFGAPWLRNIRHLELYQAWSSPLRLETPSEWISQSLLNFLKTLPLLESITMTAPSSSARIVSKPMDESIEVVQLSHLHSINFTIPDYYFCDIFEHLDTPRLRHLSVTWDKPGKSPSEKICDFYLKQTNSLPNVYEHLPSNHKIRASACRFVDKAKGLKLTMDGFTVPDSFLAEIRVLRDSSSDRPPFQDSETIEELQITEAGSLLILTEQRASDGPALPYPSLQTLLIEDVNLRPKAMYLSPMKSWLKARKESAMLPLMNLVRCGNINEKDVKDLSRYVDMLTWDGVVYRNTSSEA
ncbi:hypothetical protein ONZ45_g12518 [Pleurotus djamor]|nr:hypothetical protein ONZ45_g12518 [Pleurotus djamor]